MIDDRMEDGLSEEDAVAAVGSVEDIRRHIMDGPVLPRVRKDSPSGRRKLRPWEILLLILGSPLWFPLLIAAFTVVLSLYISLWAVLISLWAVFVSLIVSGVAVIGGGTILAAGGRSVVAIAMIGAGLVSVGLSIFLFYGCKYATKGSAALAKLLFRRMKKFFPREEEVQ